MHVAKLGMRRNDHRLCGKGVQVFGLLALNRRPRHELRDDDARQAAQRNERLLTTCVPQAP